MDWDTSLNHVVRYGARWPALLRAGRRVSFLVLAAANLAGCYTYRPVYTTPDPGQRMVLDLSDRGRIDLEQNIGPDIATVEGILRSVADSIYTLAVTEVRGLYGSRVRWNGELVTFRREHVRIMRERRYSRPHTFALATALASGTVAFIVTRGFFGLGGGETPGPGGGNPPPTDQ